MNAAICEKDVSVELPSVCRRWEADDALVIPAFNPIAPEGAFWLWNSASGRLERLLVQYRNEAAALLETWRALKPPWLPARPARQEIVASYLLALPNLNAEYAFSVCGAAADDLLVLSGSRRI